MEFWNYSFHEMGYYDTPACIDYILKENQKVSQIIYVGHSQGGASLLAGMTEKLEYYKAKILAAILLAPASRVDNIDSYILQLIKKIEIDELLKKHNVHEVLPYDPELMKLNIKFNKYYPTMSYAMLEMTSDETSWVNCPERIKMFFSHYPSGTSVKSLTHFKQLIEAKKFQCFDYGEEENLRRYGTSFAKEYDLTLIENIPIILAGGLSDKLTHINDIRWLRGQISKTLHSYHEFEFMGHASFLINSDITWFNFILRELYKITHVESISFSRQISPLIKPLSSIWQEETSVLTLVNVEHLVEEKRKQSSNNVSANIEQIDSLLNSPSKIKRNYLNGSFEGIIKLN
jgi:hypothetical protein